VGVAFQSGDLGFKAQAVEEEVVLATDAFSKLLPECEALLFPIGDLFGAFTNRVQGLQVVLRLGGGVLISGSLEVGRQSRQFLLTLQSLDLGAVAARSGEVQGVLKIERLAHSCDVGLGWPGAAAT